MTPLKTELQQGIEPGAPGPSLSATCLCTASHGGWLVSQVQRSAFLRPLLTARRMYNRPEYRAHTGQSSFVLPHAELDCPAPPSSNCSPYSPLHIVGTTLSTLGSVSSGMQSGLNPVQVLQWTLLYPTGVGRKRVGATPRARQGWREAKHYMCTMLCAILHSL